MAKFWLTAIVVMGFTFPGTAQEPVQQSEQLFAETFRDKLAPEWAWVREEPTAWRLDKQALVVRTLPGYLHATYNNSKNILLRPVPEVKDLTLAVEVFLESDPKVQYEHAGLVWYYDDDNYVALFWEFLNGTQKLQMVTEKEGKPQFAVKPSEAKQLWMRLEVSDEKITTRFRESEKDEWVTVGENQLPSVGKAKIGLMSGGAPKDAAHVVVFKDFRVLQLLK